MRMLKVMGLDKKNSGTVKKIVLLNGIGSTVERKASAVEDERIVRVLAPQVRVYPHPSLVATSASAPSAPTKKVVMDPPGSKSISNRVLVLAALGEGECVIKNMLSSDDTGVMMAALGKMNVSRVSYYYFA